MQNKMTPPKVKKVFVCEIIKIGTFSALYLDSHVFFSKKKLYGKHSIHYEKNNSLKKCKSFDKKKLIQTKKFLKIDYFNCCEAHP